MIKERFDIKDERVRQAAGSVYRHLDDAVAIFSSWVSANIQVTLWQFFTRFRGKYRFRISAYAYQTDKPVTFHMTAGTMQGGDRGPDRATTTSPRQADGDRVRRTDWRRANTIRIRRGRAGPVIPPAVEKVGRRTTRGRAWPSSGWRSKGRCTTPGRRRAIAGCSATCRRRRRRRGQRPPGGRLEAAAGRCRARSCATSCGGPSGGP